MSNFIKRVIAIYKDMGGLLFVLFALSLYYIVERKIDGYFLVAFSIYCYIKIPIKVYWDKSGLVLLLFMISYSALIQMNNLQTGTVFAITNFISPLAFYIYGKYIVENRKTTNNILAFLFLTGAISIINLMYLVVKDMQDIGIVNVNRMLGDDLEEVSATMYGLIASIAVGAIGAIFAKKWLSWLQLVLFVMLGLAGLLINIHFVNRTFILGLAFSFAVILLLNGKNHRTTFFYLFLVGTAYLVLDSGILYNSEVTDAYLFRSNYSADAASGGGRLERWGFALSSMFNYPLGFSDGNEKYYAHNLWLDIARQTGIIPFVLISLFSISGYKALYLTCKIRMDQITVMILSISAVVFVYCMAEPVIEGLPLYFYLFCMLMGMQIQTYKQTCQR